MNLAKLNFALNIFFVFSLVFVFFAYADNGISIRAEDIKAGIFGSDETGSDFSTKHDVRLESKLLTNELGNVQNDESLVIELVCDNCTRGAE